MAVHDSDPIDAVLIAATYAVDSLSEGARARLDDGAYFIRLPAHAARDLIEAVDEFRREQDG